MYIEPNTVIRLLSNIPLYNDYKNTIYFSSLSAQTNYFLSKTKHNLTRQTFQRHNKGVCRISIPVGSCYDCNYMMFQNSTFSNKWFYAFITKVEYINNEVTEITYELDDMQTWFFDMIHHPCYVIREHSLTDKAGDNLVDEHLEFGEYVVKNVHYTEHKYQENEDVIVIGSTVDGSGGDITGGFYSGMYSGVYFHVFLNAEQANGFLESIAGLGLIDSIVGVYQTKKKYILTSMQPYGDDIYVQKNTSVLNYIPRNKKLLTYPYCLMQAMTGSGNTADYRYEFFNPEDGDIHYDVFGAFNGNLNLVLTPWNYKNQVYNDRERLAYENASACCAYNIDTYKAWFAQNSVNILGNVASDILTMNPLATLVDATNVINKKLTTPPIGKLGSGNIINVVKDLDEIIVYELAITDDYARRIDSFFDEYGYATNEVKLPNRNSRPHWNYVKTKDCNITGNIPSDSLSHINSIHDNGITYWKQPENVGNYSLNNSPS